jgi:archaellum biogenesis ATPase FlaH
MNQTYKYDFVLSFAGENRAIVERVRDHLREQKMRVFYDHDEQHDLLGKDLAEHFTELYQNAAQFCVIFVSQLYLDKAWCKWERRAALARALDSNKEYIIPYVLEDVPVPGIPETIGRAYFDKTPPWVFANLLARKFKGSSGGSPNEEVMSLTNLLSKAISADSDSVWRDNTRTPRTIFTNFGDLDAALGSPLRSGTIYGIGGRPSMGKTAFALNMATRLSKQGVPVGYVTVDQPKRTVLQRLLALNARVDLLRLRNGFLNAKELSKVTVANERLSSLPLRIIDAGDSLSLDVILCELWAAISAFKLRVFFVDSLYPIYAANLFGQYVKYGLVRTLTSLKWLAQETDTTGIVCLQLSRSVESRADKTPVITDIRGGKNLARLLESIFLLHRADLYDGQQTEGTLEVFVGHPGRSQRRGPARLVFQRNVGLVQNQWDWENELDFDASLEETGADDDWG